jgi:hypothetical protein
VGVFGTSLFGLLSRDSWLEFPYYTGPSVRVRPFSQWHPSFSPATRLRPRPVRHTAPPNTPADRPCPRLALKPISWRPFLREKSKNPQKSSKSSKNANTARPKSVLPPDPPGFSALPIANMHARRRFAKPSMLRVLSFPRLLLTSLRFQSCLLCFERGLFHTPSSMSAGREASLSAPPSLGIRAFCQFGFASNHDQDSTLLNIVFIQNDSISSMGC